MKTVRLDDNLESRLRQASALSGMSESELIREGIRKQCDEVLERRLDARLADVIGSVESGAIDSRNSGREFKRILAKRNKERRA